MNMHVVRNFKFLNFQHLLKCILLGGGLTQHLWVIPLCFSALQLDPSISVPVPLPLSLNYNVSTCIC